MKKLISMVLVLCMAATMVSALAETDVTGEWYGSMMGFSMKMVLNADGTGEMTVVGQGTSPATWTMEGDQITITANDSPATGTVTADGEADLDGEREHGEGGALPALAGAVLLGELAHDRAAGVHFHA